MKEFAMSRRVRVRSHYRNTRRGGFGGALILLLILVGITWVIRIVAAIPAWAWITIVLGLLGIVAMYGAIHLVPQTIHKRKEQQIQLQHAQTYSLPPGRSISQETKIKVFTRDGGRCVQCGSPYNLQYDHIIPFSLGGGNGPENIQILCAPCNRRKYNNI